MFFSPALLTVACLMTLPLDPTTGFALSRVVPADAPLIHTGQVYPTRHATLSEQVREALDKLAAVTGGLDRIVRLHGVVAPGVNDAELLRELQARFPDRSMRPALTLVRSHIEVPGMLVGFDAVAIFADGNTVTGISAMLPAEGRIDIAGQAEKADGTIAAATHATLESLERTLKHLGSDRSKIVQLKAFYQPANQAETVRKTVKQFFRGEDPPLVLVEWNMAIPIEIEVVAATGNGTSKGLRFVTPPGMTTSPVYSRTAVTEGRFETIYTAGLFAPTGTPPKDQAKPVFDQLKTILNQTGTDMRHLTKATYYVSNPDANKSLDAIRPSLYDPTRPPTASKAGVLGVIPAQGQGLLVDMIAVKPHR